MSRRTLSTIAALLLVAGLSAPSVALAERVRVPGTGASLEPPVGFSLAERFPGFQLAERGASIMVTELPGPAEAMRRGMTRKQLASRGMTLIQSRSVTVQGAEALLLHVTQVAKGTEYAKWMLVTGDAGKTVMVVGTYHRADADLSGPVKRAVLSSRWSDAANVDPFEGLPFRVEPTPGLRLARRVANMIVFTETGDIGPTGSDQAVLVVGSSLSDVDVGSLEDFARERAARTEHVKALRGVVGREIEIDGLRGYELTAEANDGESDRPVGLYQLLLVDGRTYYIAQGIVGGSRAGELLPDFRRVTGSFRRVVDRGPASPHETEPARGRE
jgi:hypothetical protein